MGDIEVQVVSEKQVKKVKKEILNKKVRGEAHINHKSKHLEAKKVGPDCRCKRYKCFNEIAENRREEILKQFYSIPTKNLQDSHLSGLIKTLPVKQRRPRKYVNRIDTDSEDGEKQEKFFHSVSFMYSVRVKSGTSDKFADVNVCRDAFLSLHGLSRGRLRRIQNSLSQTSASPLDRRGSHKNRPNKTPPEAEALIHQYIRSFPARQSHYSLRLSIYYQI